MRSLLKASELRKLIDYDPTTGLFTWRARNNLRWDSRYAGSQAGALTKNNAIQIAIHGKLYFAHRLAFVWMTGRWPDLIDHKDGNPSNNKWENLRNCNQSKNNMNRRNKAVKGQVKLKGVYVWRNQKFAAQIKAKKKWKWLGLHDTAEKAALAYDAACVELHGEFAVTNKMLGLL